MPRAQDHVDAEALVREVERYLATVDEFRRLGHGPQWLCERWAEVDEP